MQERAQSEETWEVHVAEQCWLGWMEKESPISKPLDAPNWHVWDTRSLLQKEMEVGTAYQELVLESLEKEISCYSSREAEIESTTETFVLETLSSWM